MKSGDWSWLEITKIGAGLLTPLAVFYLSFATQGAIREQEAEQQRREMVRTLSVDIYARRTAAELLLSGIRRHQREPTAQSRMEVIERKRAYDDTYISWNRNIQANLLGIRSFLGADAYTRLEAVVEVYLVGVGLGPLDSCLTQAYDETIRDRDAEAVLSDCNAGSKVTYVRDCGYAITNELFAVSDTPARSRTRDAFLSGQIAERCGIPEGGGRLRRL